jgi:hypothetical protein
MNKLSKKWKIFITAMVVLVGSLYGVYKINNRNAFEEMYNSYYNILPLRTVDNMPEIETIPKKLKNQDVIYLVYKENTDKNKVKFSLTENKIALFYSEFIEENVWLDITYSYNVSEKKLKNYISFRGENVPTVDDEQKQTKDLLEKYNISKEYLQEKSDELLDTVLTDWKNYSGSSYSRDNMGRLTIEKDEFLR